MTTPTHPAKFIGRLPIIDLLRLLSPRARFADSLGIEAGPVTWCPHCEAWAAEAVGIDTWWCSACRHRGTLWSLVGAVLRDHEALTYARNAVAEEVAP